MHPISLFQPFPIDFKEGFISPEGLWYPIVNSKIRSTPQLVLQNVIGKTDLPITIKAIRDGWVHFSFNRFSSTLFIEYRVKSAKDWSPNFWQRLRQVFKSFEDNKLPIVVEGYIFFNNASGTVTYKIEYTSAHRDAHFGYLELMSKR